MSRCHTHARVTSPLFLLCACAYSVGAVKNVNPQYGNGEARATVEMHYFFSEAFLNLGAQDMSGDPKIVSEGGKKLLPRMKKNSMP